MIEKIKLNASDENLRHLTETWNAEHEPSRQIDRTHLIRLKSTIPQFSTSAEFWSTVSSQVAEEVKIPDARSRNTPPDGGLDYDGYQTKALNAERIEWISQAEWDAIKFDFREDDKQIQATKIREANSGTISTSAEWRTVHSAASSIRMRKRF